MKYIWDQNDIKAGRRIQTPSKATEQWIIGYIIGDGNDKYYLVSLSDGTICSRKTKQELAISLNEGGYIPLSL